MKNKAQGVAVILAGLITSDQWFNLSKTGLEQCLDKMAAALARREN